MFKIIFEYISGRNELPYSTLNLNGLQVTRKFDTHSPGVVTGGKVVPSSHKRCEILFRSHGLFFRFHEILLRLHEILICVHEILFRLHGILLSKIKHNMNVLNIPP